MNKELTPLETLHSLVEIFATKKYDEKGNLIYWENILDTLSKNGEYRIIEKSLKVLEIIIKKDVHISIFKSCETLYEYNSLWKDSDFRCRTLTQQEYDLLKEVLL